MFKLEVMKKISEKVIPLWHVFNLELRVENLLYAVCELDIGSIIWSSETPWKDAAITPLLRLGVRGGLRSSY